jgi:cysteine synthase
LTTGPEIIRQSGGQIDAFCDFVGTAGSFAGCAAAFKEFNPRINCYVVEPAESAVLAGMRVTNPNHRIQGGGYQFTEPNALNRKHVDGFVQVSDQEAIDASCLLAREEGIFAGYSSGANLSAALKLMAKDHVGKTIAILINDSGMKYISTELWNTE